ncbi:MAG TPA: sigma factor, partial [Candidatus Binataceae bacterium]
MDRASIESVFRAEYGRIIASLIRVLGDFELAEDSAQDAFMAAMEQWPREGAPQNPRAWIISVARHKAIDRLRRNGRFDSLREEFGRIRAQPHAGLSVDETGNALKDERLRLIFTCCHPGLAVEAQVALSLRTLCGLTTDEIARAFLVPAP